MKKPYNKAQIPTLIAQNSANPPFLQSQEVIEGYEKGRSNTGQSSNGTSSFGSNIVTGMPVGSSRVKYINK